MAKKAVTPEVEAPKLPSEEELKARAVEARNARSAQCVKELHETLKKYNCVVVTRPRIESGAVVADWGVQALE